MTQQTAGPALKTRKPTGQVPFPLILIEGPEKAGKSLIPVVLSRSPRLGTIYWLDLGEGSADEYAALPGSDYLVVDHDGSYRDILEQLTAVWNVAEAARLAGEPPVGIVVDSMSALWTMLVNWTNDRARRSNVGKRKLADDPDAEIDPTSNLWNDANGRHKRVMDLLMTFPGLAIVTARGKEVVKMVNGQPDRNGATEWKVEGQKFLAFDASAWIRVSREPRTAQLIGARSLRLNVEGRSPLAMPMTKVGSWDVVDLEEFVFGEEWMGCTGGAARHVVTLVGDALQGLLGDVEVCPTEDDLQAIWQRSKDQVTPDDRVRLLEAVNARLGLLRANVADEATLEAHGPQSDAEKLRAAAAAAGTEEPRTGHEERGERDGGGDS